MPDTRRDDIADAAIRIIERDGLRGLTHRAVDRELGLAVGSTSYYARTRRQLIELAVHRLADRTSADAPDPGPGPLPSGPLTAGETSTMLAAAFDRIVARDVDARARFALTVDLVHDPELHALITDRSPVRRQLLAGAEAVLRGLGVEAPADRAVDLVALTNGLMYDRLAGSGLRGPAADVASVLGAYLDGLPRMPSVPD